MWLVLATSGFAFAVLLHAIFARMGGSLTLVLTFLCISIPIAILTASVAVWSFGISDESIAAIMVYLACCETYIFLFTLAANGVSVSMMMRLSPGPIATDELLKSYTARGMVERRIDQLRAGGFVTESNGQIRLLERGQTLVRAFSIAQSLFKHRHDASSALEDQQPPRSRL
jgi:hypothetical protein